MTDVAEAIECFETPLTVRRTNSTTTFVDGIAQTNTNVDTFCLEGANMQSMNARERQVLPELIRDRETRKIYTTCELRSVEVEGKLRADRIEWNRQRYIVQSIEDWTDDGGYYKVIVVKEDD